MPPTKLGTLVVVVLKARNLPNPSMYKQSPYMLVRLGGGGQRTKVDVKGGQNPIWDEDLQFEIYSQDHDEPRVLRLSCFVEGRKRIDEGIGEGELQIDDVLRRGEFDGWIPLSLNDTQRGEVYLELTFFANTQALGRRPSKLSPAERLYRPSPPRSPRGPSPRPSSPQSNVLDAGLSLPQANRTSPLNLPPRQQPAPAPGAGAGSASSHPSSPPRTPHRPQQRYGQSSNTHTPPHQSPHLSPLPNSRRNDNAFAPASEYGVAYYDPLFNIDTVPASSSGTLPTSVPPSLQPGGGIPYLDAIPAPTMQSQTASPPTLVAPIQPLRVDPPAYTPALPPRQPQQHHESEALEAQRIALEGRDRRRRQEEEDEALARQLMLEEEENERRERDRARQAGPNIWNYATSQGSGRRLPGSWGEE